MKDLIDGIDPSWKINLELLKSDYRDFLLKDHGYIPKKEHIFNAFKTLKMNDVKYVLFGQDPYPRAKSASGYAFIDGNVKSIFDKRGTLSADVNRATSLRNFIKMTLLAREDLSKDDLSPHAIIALDKSDYINDIWQLKDNFEKNGVLLLNTSLVFTDKKSCSFHARAWESFIIDAIDKLDHQKVKLILFGSFAKSLYDNNKSLQKYDAFVCEHPYNISFITNNDVLDFFRPMDLLSV
jgi:uracil-DNA glycosylase